MEVAQFRYAHDNLAYLIYGRSTAIAVDGGAPEEMVGFAREKGLELVWVTNTHTHPDHTLGNALLLEMTGAGFLDCRTFSHGQKIRLEPGQELEVLLTPGHTQDSVCFKGEGFLITGDTLFNATVGNCFSGDFNAFYRSLKLLMALPGQTRVFAGHDYVQESLAAAWSIDKGNPDLGHYEKKYNSDLVVSTLADELRVNPYLRFNSPAIVKRLEQRGMPRETEVQRFASLMEIY